MFQYRVKVQGRKYLVGSSEINETIGAAAILFVKVDDLGERIQLGCHLKGVPNGRTIGYLGAGQSYVLKLDDIAGVWAQADATQDSVVDCVIIPGVQK